MEGEASRIMFYVHVQLVVDYYEPQQGKFELLRFPRAPLRSYSPRCVADLSRYLLWEGGQTRPSFLPFPSLRPTLNVMESPNGSATITPLVKFLQHY